MTLARLRPWWPALLVGLLALTTFYHDALQTRFLNDDYLFLEQAEARPLAESLGELGPLGNYFRPLSRQIYFETLGPLAGGHPIVFHLVNYVFFLVALGLLADLLRALRPAPVAWVGVLYFALLPFQRVNLTWVSCSQDLLALAASLATLAFYRRGRSRSAMLCYVLALASKESALPLPVALMAWDKLMGGLGWRVALRRAVPFAGMALLWASLAWWMRTRHPTAAPLQFEIGHVAANYVHLFQSLVGLETPGGLLGSLIRNGPAVVPLLLFAMLPWMMPRGPNRNELPSSETPPRAGAMLPAPRVVVVFAMIWLLALGIAPAPVAYSWSAYYFTLAAVGGAVLSVIVFSRLGKVGWMALVTGLLWLHAGSTGVRAFAVAERPWVWTSHLTSFYFQRAASIADALSAQLLALEPSPPPHTRFFFATLPPWAGFQMGNGALIRRLYQDSSIESFFFSQFSDSSAGAFPLRFVYWDGAALRPLYEGVGDPFFQIGSDLLLLDRPAGAAHAFRRGLDRGENPRDHLYWLGWAELFRGRRMAAESAWSRFGARDDSLLWISYLRAARTRLDDRDTLGAKRDLARSIEFGIGRPEAHAALGNLLMPERPKYATLELMVATFLNPQDWLSRRDLVVALTDARLEDRARHELETLQRIHPAWQADSALASTERRLDRTVGGGVATF